MYIRVRSFLRDLIRSWSVCSILRHPSPGGANSSRRVNAFVKPWRVKRRVPLSSRGRYTVVTRYTWRSSHSPVAQEQLGCVHPETLATASHLAKVLQDIVGAVRLDVTRCLGDDAWRCITTFNENRTEIWIFWTFGPSRTKVVCQRLKTSFVERCRQCDIVWQVCRPSVFIESLTFKLDLESVEGRVESWIFESMRPMHVPKQFCWVMLSACIVPTGTRGIGRGASCWCNPRSGHVLPQCGQIGQSQQCLGAEREIDVWGACACCSPDTLRFESQVMMLSDRSDRSHLGGDWRPLFHFALQFSVFHASWLFARSNVLLLHLTGINSAPSLENCWILSTIQGCRMLMNVVDWSKKPEHCAKRFGPEASLISWQVSFKTMLGQNTNNRIE